MAKATQIYDYYTSAEGLAKLTEWKGKGLSDTQIATNMGIGRATLNRWANKNPEIKSALSGGLELQEKELVNALFRKAVGYKDTEVQVERYKLDGKVIENDPKFPVKEKITTKTFPPDVGAIAFILKCRFGWKEKSFVEVEDNRESPLSGLTTEELRKLANACDK